jgi:hypothetical protein
MISFKNFDVFGHNVTLNYNRRGSEHKTCVGGLFSVLIYIVMMLLVLRKVITMAKFEDDKIVQSVSHVNHEEYIDHTVQLNSSSIKPILIMLSPKRGPSGAMFPLNYE